MIASPDVKRYAMSVINGIMVPTGNHVDFVFNKIQSATKANIQSSLGARDLPSIPGIRTISTRLAIIILWRATGVHWSGQSKNCAQFRTCDLISPSDSFIEALSKILADFVISRIDSLTGPRNGQNSGKTRIAIDKYTPANFAGTKKSAQCRLFLAEGDSAKSQVAKGLSRTFGFDYYGILSLRGVIPNVRKQAMQQVDSSTGEVKHKRSQKLIDNKFMTTLVQVLGIDFSKKYTSAQERQTLRYGGIIGCVDQDLDGVGNIFSLLLNLFHVFWPALIDAGFVQRLATPIIRAFPKTSKSKVHVLEFYSDEEYRKWVAETPNAESAFEISYYKGLGKHSPLEMQHIMSSIKTQIITYQNDPRALEMFEIYLGRLPELRKIQLARAPPRADPDLDRELLRSRRIPASYHLMRETHTYQLDNLHRKLNDVIGGMNQVLCKIVDGCFKIYARSANEKRKVVDLAGTISTMENYHHGETSLQDAILRRGFIAPGGNQLPFLLPGGNFGTRGKGGQDASAARYMTAQFNVRVNSVLYQAEDYSLLDFHIDEGKRGEPTFFVPIIPTAITEQIDVPAHGWNIRIWAREVMDVIANVRMLINTNGVASPLPMRPCCYPRVPIEPLPSTPPWNAECERVICNCTGADNASRYLWHGYIIERAFGKHPETWSIGTYTWISDDTILITELPLCVWTEPYMQNITKIADREGSMIKKFQYAPDDVKVNIRITFNLMSESFSALGITTREGDSPACLNDPLIVALYLRDHMSDNLNFMMPDESVHTFDTYQDIVAYWFPIRREYYARRVARQSELISVWILYYENIVRYIHMKREETIKSIAQTTVEEAEKILTEAHFNPLDTAALESPEIRFEVHVRERIINSSNASFAYILNLRERDVTLDGCKKFETELAKERAKLAELTAFAAIDMPSAPFIGAKIWLSELDTLVARINEGRATEWQFKDYGRFIYT